MKPGADEVTGAMRVNPETLSTTQRTLREMKKRTPVTCVDATATEKSPAPQTHVRLPRTPNSHGLSYAILIRRVHPHRTMGDVFEGRRVRPGANLTAAELWPTPDYPEVPLLLEYAASDRSGSGHRRRSHHLYLLWEFLQDANEWRELARANAEALEWIEVLRPAAMRHLKDARRESEAALAEMATARILTVLELELDVLADAERRNFLGMVYEQFTARLVRDGVAEVGAL